MRCRKEVLGMQSDARPLVPLRSACVVFCVVEASTRVMTRSQSVPSFFLHGADDHDTICIEDVVEKTLEIVVSAVKRVRLKTEIAYLQFGRASEWSNAQGPEDPDRLWLHNVSRDSVTDECNLGSALRELNERLTRQEFLSNQHIACAPIIIFVSNGRPTDDYEPRLKALRTNKWFRRARRFAFAVGNEANREMLSQLTDSMGTVFEPDESGYDALGHAMSSSFQKFVDLPIIYAEEELSAEVPLSLHRVVELALRRYEVDALRNARILLAFALDYMDLESKELRVLERYGERGLLSPYVKACEESGRLEVAAFEAAYWLRHQCCVDGDVARSIAEEIMIGIENVERVRQYLSICEREAELIVFFAIDRSSCGGSIMTFLTDRVVKECLDVIRAEIARSGIHVRVAAFAYTYDAHWITSDGPKEIEDFEIEDMRSIAGDDICWTMGCGPGSALYALDTVLSRGKGFECSSGYCKHLIVFVSGGYCSSGEYSGRKESFVDGIEKAKHNRWFARATRVALIPIVVEGGVGLLSAMTSNEKTVLKSYDLDKFADIIRHSCVEALWTNAWFTQNRIFPWAYLSLEKVVELALNLHGGKVFCDSGKLMEYAQSHLDPNSDVSKGLNRCGDRLLFETFAQIMEGSLDVEEGRREAFRWLTEAWRLSPEVAQKIIDGIVGGIAAFHQDSFSKSPSFQASNRMDVSVRPVGRLVFPRRHELSNWSLSWTDNDWLGTESLDERDCLTVLREIRETSSDGHACLILVVRNNAPMSLGIEASFVFVDERGTKVTNVTRYTVLGPGERALLSAETQGAGWGEHGVDADYSFRIAASNDAPLARGLEVLDESVEPGRIALLVCNTSDASAHVECLQLFGVRHEIVQSGRNGRKISEHRELDPMYLRTVLAPGETRKVYSHKDCWNDLQWRVYPVGFLQERRVRHRCHK